MRTTKFIHYLLILFILSGNYAYADDLEIGDVSIQELKMKSYDADPDAPAVILADKGNVYFRASGQGNLQVVFERHVRIKILSKEGYSEANIDIPLYDFDQRDDHLRNFDAFTFNLEDGKIVKDELKKNEIIYDDASKYLDYAKISMPSVRVGSVIDIEYKITQNGSAAINDWYFQYDIPVISSELRVVIPEWFYYAKTVRGYEPVDTQPEKSTLETFLIFGDYEKVHSTVHRFKADSMPAFVEEPYMLSKENYISKVTFELMSTHFPGQIVNNYSQTWADVSKQLLEHSSFGREINRNHLRKEAKAIMNQTGSDRERLQLAHEKVQSLVKYNGSDDIIPYDGRLKTSIKDKSGNAADINLNLIALLRSMDIEANPVVLSTREHGIIHPSHASIKALNYVLALVHIGEQQILVDATDPYLPLGYIPYRCLNGKGILLDKDNPKMIPLHSTEEYGKHVSMTVDFSGDTITGEMKVSYSGYHGTEKWKEYTEQGEKNYIEEMSANYDEWNLSDVELKWGDNNTLEQRCKLEKSTNNQSLPGMLYLDAIYGNSITENPFKLQQRKHPVDFGCPHKYSYQIVITLPEGYRLESTPEKAIVSLPENGGSFKYLTSSMGQQLIISSVFTINKVMFNYMEYPMIKKLYQIAVDKYSEKIVLKKNSGTNG